MSSILSASLVDDVSHPVWEECDGTRVCCIPRNSWSESQISIKFNVPSGKDNYNKEWLNDLALTKVLQAPALHHCILLFRKLLSVKSGSHWRGGRCRGWRFQDSRLPLYKLVCSFDCPRHVLGRPPLRRHYATHCRLKGNWGPRYFLILSLVVI